MTVCSSYCAAVTLNKLEPQYRVLPKFPEALIFNCLPARHVGIAGPIGTVRSSTPEPSILILMTLDQPPNWENVRWNWRIPPLHSEADCRTMCALCSDSARTACKASKTLFVSLEGLVSLFKR